MLPLFNYEQITEMLKTFMQSCGLIPISPSNYIKNSSFNSGLAYEEEDLSKRNNVFVVQGCSRINDIEKKDKLATLAFFHMFSISPSLKLNELIDFLKYLIKVFQLQPSKFQLNTIYPLEYLVEEINKKCGINNVKYYDKNEAFKLKNGEGYLVYPADSKDEKNIFRTLSIYYEINENIQIEIIQIVEFRDFCNNKNYGLSVGIERLYTAINHNIPNVFIPSWSNTIPLFKQLIEKESKELGVQLPPGYDLIIKS